MIEPAEHAITATIPGVEIAIASPARSSAPAAGSSGLVPTAGSIATVAMTPAATTKLSAFSASGIVNAQQGEQACGEKRALLNPNVNGTSRTSRPRPGLLRRQCPAAPNEVLVGASRSQGRLRAPKKRSRPLYGQRQVQAKGLACEEAAALPRLLRLRGYRSAHHSTHEPDVDRRKEVGEQYRSDRPWRVKEAVREQQQRDVSGSANRTGLRPRPDRANSAAEFRSRDVRICSKPTGTYGQVCDGTAATWRKDTGGCIASGRFDRQGAIFSSTIGGDGMPRLN